MRTPTLWLTQLAPALLFTPAAVRGCPHPARCGFPRDNVYTTDGGGSVDAEECCAVMPPVFLLPTGPNVVRPPTGAEPERHCWPTPGGCCGDRGADPDGVCCDAVGQGMPPDIAQTYGYLLSAPNAATRRAREGWPTELATCEATHPFYTQYTNAYEGSDGWREGVAVLGSDAVPLLRLLA